MLSGRTRIGAGRPLRRLRESTAGRPRVRPGQGPWLVPQLHRQVVLRHGVRRLFALLVGRLRRQRQPIPDAGRLQGPLRRPRAGQQVPFLSSSSSASWLDVSSLGNEIVCVCVCVWAQSRAICPRWWVRARATIRRGTTKPRRASACRSATAAASATTTASPATKSATPPVWRPNASVSLCSSLSLSLSLSLKNESE